MTVLTDDVWPRSVARRVGVGVVRACKRDVWSPDAVSYSDSFSEIYSEICKKRRLATFVSSVDHFKSNIAFPCALHHHPFSSLCMPSPSSTSKILTPPSSPAIPINRRNPWLRASELVYCFAIWLNETARGGAKSRGRPVGGWIEGNSMEAGGLRG